MGQVQELPSYDPPEQSDQGERDDNGGDHGRDAA